MDDIEVGGIWDIVRRERGSLGGALEKR